MKKELLSKKEQELENSEDSYPIGIAKHKKVYSEKNTQDVAEQLFDRELMGTESTGDGKK